MFEPPKYSIEAQNLSCLRNNRVLFSDLNFSVSSGCNPLNKQTKLKVENSNTLLAGVFYEKTRHTDSQIISILKQNESGTSVAVNMV
jgi:hypothetical protein